MSAIHSTTIVDSREQRARQIVAISTIRPSEGGDAWIVPSQSNNGRYTVKPQGESLVCTCPDHTIRRKRCKHIIAVEITISQTATVESDGDTTTVTVTQSKTKRVTYRQDWPAYNAAQTQEKATFQALLHDLCRNVPQPVQTFGRPRLSLADMVFSAAFKVYSTVSGRRFMTDLTEAHAKGYIGRVPHYNCIFNAFESPGLTPILRDLIGISAAPLKAVEQDFAVDSSGFSTSRFVQWFNVRYGKQQDNHEWVKMHLMCGVKTNIVTSVEISGAFANDAPFFAPLVEQTARRFTLREVSADKAYSTRKNLAVVDQEGGTPYIPFRSLATGGKGDKPSLWRQLYHYYEYSRDDFLAHYHKRSNVETVFSMIKAKFGASLRSKTDTALVNEALCKVLCHNICVVISSIHELGIDPTFWADTAVAQEVG